MRMTIVVSFICLVLAGVAVMGSAAQSPVIEVYKSATCGCCRVWVSHLEEHGFTVRATDVADMGTVKARAGVPPVLGSCHTGIVEGYVVEGHVPAADVQRMLAERPDIAGIAVPGMPIGSPGMEGPNPQPYDVIAFEKDGSFSRYSSYAP